MHGSCATSRDTPPGSLAKRATNTRTIQQSLNELEAAGYLRSHRSGREKVFAIHRAHWTSLIQWPNTEGEFPRWIPWEYLFGAIEAFLNTLDDPALDEKSDALRAIAMRETLATVSPDLVRAGVTPEMQADVRMKGAELIEAVLADITRLLK